MSMRTFNVDAKDAWRGTKIAPVALESARTRAPGPGRICLVLLVIYHLQNVSGRFSCKVNGTGLFGSSREKNFLDEERNI